MATRIPVAWLFVVALIAVFAFFGYHILQASSEAKPVEKYPPYSPADEERAAAAAHALSTVPVTRSEVDTDGAEAPVVHKQPPVPHAMPRVPGQTEDDLRAPEPLQATPPAVQYDAPEATDPLNRTAYMGAEFGSNFRHPEQMMEARPAMTMGSAVPAGLASDHTNPGGHRVVAYAQEMAQNGGEFMPGIAAFDVSESGVAFSML